MVEIQPSELREKIFQAHLITTRTSEIVYIHEFVVRAQPLFSVAQFVRTLYRKRRATGSTPARRPSVAFFETVSGEV